MKKFNQLAKKKKKKFSTIKTKVATVAIKFCNFFFFFFSMPKIGLALKGLIFYL